MNAFKLQYFICAEKVCWNIDEFDVIYIFIPNSTKYNILWNTKQITSFTWTNLTVDVFSTSYFPFPSTKCLFFWKKFSLKCWPLQLVGQFCQKTVGHTYVLCSSLEIECPHFQDSYRRGRKVLCDFGGNFISHPISYTWHWMQI